MTVPADYSVLWEERLVAYLWRRSPGRIYRNQHQAPLAETHFVEVQLFDSLRVELFVRLAGQAKNFDAFLFELGLEGFTVTPGAVAPAAHNRRF